MHRIFAALTIGAVTFSTAVNAQQLTYGTYFKATHNIIKDAIKPYFDEVSKSTNNALTFKLLTDATLVGASTTAKGVQQGLVDTGTIIPIYTSSTFPVTALLCSLPLFKTDSLIETARSTNCSSSIAMNANLNGTPSRSHRRRCMEALPII